MAESRAYRLEAGESLPDGIRRVARGRIDHALDELLGRTESSPEEAVHEARKNMKKLRALLRLARGELGKATFKRENACFRDAAREVAGFRDADVMLETLASLELPLDPRELLRIRVEAEQDGAHTRGRKAAARRAAAILSEARGRVDDWPLERDSFTALAEGLERSYRRGRREFKAAREDPSTELLHEWRKRAKELWYHHTLLGPAWPAPLTAYGDEAHALSDRLGDDHDLALLAERVAGEPVALEAIGRRRAELQAEALVLGERLYAEKPSAYIRRLETLWDARAAEVRAP